MKFAYQRGGAPLLDWSNGPPRQSRAADTLALGSLSEPTLVLPRAGAPEVMGDVFAAGPRGRRRPKKAKAMGDCGCGGGDPETIMIDLTSPSFYVGLGIGYILSRVFFK